VVELRLLWHTLRVEGDAEALAHLRVVLPQAEHPMAPRRAMHYEIVRVAGGFAVVEEGDALTTASDAVAAAEAVHVRAHRRAFELASLAGWVRVHAATVDLDGARVLVVGPSGAGKTTLATRLLLEGADVQGDESVLVRRDASLAVPRALHLKPGYEQWLPEVAAIRDSLPTVGEVAILDPAQLGRPWRLREAPVDHVVLLDALPVDPLAGAPADAPRCAPADGGAVLAALLDDAFPVAETKARMVATLAGAIGRARGHRLAVGPPAAMVETLRAVVS
jgi:hypothetical protein